MTGCCIKRVGFFIVIKGVGLSLEVFLPSRKALKTFITDYLSSSIHIMTAVDVTIFKKIFKTINLRRKR